MGSSEELSPITSITFGEYLPETCRSVREAVFTFRWLPFDPTRNFPDLGPRFIRGERALRKAEAAKKASTLTLPAVKTPTMTDDVTAAGEEPIAPLEDMDDEVDLSWSTVLKRTFEAYLRGERPNMYGEGISWEGL